MKKVQHFLKSVVLSILVLFLFENCTGQEEKIITETIVSDFSSYPFYENITTISNGELQLKEGYTYIDSIAVSEVTYVSDKLKIKGFIVRPKKKGKYPVIIYNRGGSYEFGALNMGIVSIWLGKIAKEGYVVLASQYRGNSGSEGEEEFGGDDVNDVLNLIPLSKELSYADSDRIGMYGWSRGGMMTYLSLIRTDKIKTAVIGGAVSDFRLNEKNRPGFTDYIPDFERNPDKEYDKRSPILWADKFSKKVPLLLLHGNSDWRVKSEHSLRMALEFDKHRIPYRLIIYEGADHGISEYRTEVDDQILDWFNKYLKEDTPLPNMEFHGG